MKPLPTVNGDSQPYWDGARAGELRYQRCSACGEAQFPPGRVCARCLSDRVDWMVSEGHGTVHSFTVVHRPPTPDFRADVPYVIALVDLEEGFRVMVNLRGEDALTASIGSLVDIIFEATERDEIVLPQGRLAAREEAAT